MVARTFPDLVAGLLRDDAARPLVTFYDDATGERVELSVATFANWVAKTASLTQDELDLEPGDLVVLDLPTHWLGAVWLLAAWTAGYRVGTCPAAATEASLVVCGPAGVERHRGLTSSVPVVALSLRPLGGRFTEPLPPGMTDYGAVVLAQPDVFVPVSPPAPGTDALVTEGGAHSHQELIADAAEHPLVEPGGRLLTDVNPCTPEGVALLTAVLVQSAGSVWVANPDEAIWPQRKQQERATTERRAVPAR